MFAITTPEKESWKKQDHHLAQVFKYRGAPNGYLHKSTITTKNEATARKAKSYTNVHQGGVLENDAHSRIFKSCSKLNNIQVTMLGVWRKC